MGVNCARTLVIGGAGFIGTHLVPALRADPFFGQVFAPVRGELDLTDPQQIHACLANFKPTSIVNLSGYATIREVDSTDLFARNTLSVVNLLNGAVGLGQRPRVITCSSAYVYTPNPASRLKERSPLAPRNLYAVSKVAAEMAVSVCKADCEVTIARIFNAVGVGQSAEFLLPKVISAVRSRNFPLNLNSLGDMRDFIDVRDLCQMFSVTLKAAEAPSIINFCNGASVSISEIIHALGELVGFSIPVVVSQASQPVSIVRGDNSLLRSLGYERRHQLMDTLSWMLDDAKIRG